MGKKIEEFKGLSRKFTKSVLGNFLPDNNCFTISFPLSLHLDNNGFKNTLRAGHFYNDSKKDGTPHFWLKLDNETDNIIDPTAKQFYTHMNETIFFGPKPKDYCEVNRTFEQWFDDYEGNDGSFKTWAKALLKHEEIEPLPPFVPIQELPKQNKRDIKELLEINLTAASLLYVECKEKKITPSKLHKKYFTCIHKIILKFHGKTEMTGLSLPKEFERLLEDFLELR